jgi:transposase
MAGFRQPEVPRDQIVLWSQRLEDALPVDHPVRHVDHILHSESFRETFRDWENDYMLSEGKPPYHPRYLSGLYLYGMLTGVRSSRKLEAAGYNRIDVIWLMAGQCPDHATIAAFVKDHGKPLRRLFRDVLKVADLAGLVKLEQVAIDGTKIEADAGKGSVHKEESIQKYLGKLDEQIEKQAALLPKDRDERIDKPAFTYDAENDTYGCPMGQTLKYVHSSQDRKKSGVMIRRQYGNGTACAMGPIASLCCKDPKKGRTINRDQYEEHRERLRARMNSEEGRQKYKKRRETVEPRIGWAKRGLGVRRFMRRGLEAVTTEWSLVATAMNAAIRLRNWEKVMPVIG